MFMLNSQPQNIDSSVFLITGNSVGEKNKNNVTSSSTSIELTTLLMIFVEFSLLSSFMDVPMSVVLSCFYDLAEMYLVSEILVVTHSIHYSRRPVYL